jgi:hypothetical protein
MMLRFVELAGDSTHKAALLTAHDNHHAQWLNAAPASPSSSLPPPRGHLELTLSLGPHASALSSSSSFDSALLVESAVLSKGFQLKTEVFRQRKMRALKLAAAVAARRATVREAEALRRAVQDEAEWAEASVRREKQRAHKERLDGMLKQNALRREAAAAEAAQAEAAMKEATAARRSALEAAAVEQVVTVCCLGSRDCSVFWCVLVIFKSDSSFRVLPQRVHCVLCVGRSIMCLSHYR